MEIWAGVVGVVIGSLLTMLGSRIDSGRADRRLQSQLEHADQQREDDRRTAILNEAAEHLRTLIEIVTDKIPIVTQESYFDVPGMNQDDYEPWMSAQQKAVVAMKSIQDEESLVDLRQVSDLSHQLFAATDLEDSVSHLPHFVGCSRPFAGTLHQA